MSKKSHKDAPLAPGRVKFRLRFRLKRQGRQDAKKYRSLQDFTRTHALISSESTSHAGQRAVNKWFIDNISPINTGNARILIHRQSAEQQILNLVAGLGTLSGRQLRRAETQIHNLEMELVNLKAQYRANISSGDAIESEAEQASDSWKSYFNNLAAIYTRARARKAKGSPSSSSAEVPQFVSMPIPDIKNIRQADWDSSDEESPE